MKIAMWSGPRNLSTAMMYSFGNRQDCAISDEPFYGAYLKATGLDHPMREDVIQSQIDDPLALAELLTSPNPPGKAIWYQKHMTHHMVSGFPLGWLRDFKNVFLIRHPARVIASYRAKREDVTLQDIGLQQQLSLMDYARSIGHAPLVVDSTEIRNNPEPMLRALCAKLQISFDPAMLSWRPGPRDADGVWASHWYGAVHKSTGFEPEGPLPKLDEVGSRLLADAMPLYQAMAKKALTPSSVTRGEQL